MFWACRAAPSSLSEDDEAEGRVSGTLTGTSSSLIVSNVSHTNETHSSSAEWLQLRASWVTHTHTHTHTAELSVCFHGLCLFSWTSVKAASRVFPLTLKAPHPAVTRVHARGRICIPPAWACLHVIIIIITDVWTDSSKKEKQRIKLMSCFHVSTVQTSFFCSDHTHESL